jgi:hypothetical protein
MECILRTRAMTIGVAAAIAVSAVTPSVAAPFLANTAAVKSAVAGDVVDVRWRGGGVAAGIATGLAVGAIAGAASQSYYYGGDPYYYGGYYGGPAYAAPAYGPGYGYDPGYSYYRRAPQYDSSGVATNPSYYCPPGAAAQNRC